MDARNDGEPFKELLKQLWSVFHEGFEPKKDQIDSLRETYWRALRDVPFAEVKANAQRIIATATKDTPFPRPAMLRSSPLRIEPSGLPSPGQLKAERDSLRRWRSMKDADPVAFEIEWRTSRAFTAMAQSEDGSEEHTQWLREYQRWGALRYAPRAEQESAVRMFLGEP